MNEEIIENFEDCRKKVDDILYKEKDIKIVRKIAFYYYSQYETSMLENLRIKAENVNSLFNIVAKQNLCSTCKKQYTDECGIGMALDSYGEFENEPRSLNCSEWSNSNV